MVAACIVTSLVKDLSSNMYVLCFSALTSDSQWLGG